MCLCPFRYSATQLLWIMCLSEREILCCALLRNHSSLIIPEFRYSRLKLKSSSYAWTIPCVFINYAWLPISNIILQSCICHFGWKRNRNDFFFFFFGLISWFYFYFYFLKLKRKGLHFDIFLLDTCWISWKSSVF